MSLPVIPGQGEHFPRPRRGILKYLTDTATIIYYEPLDPYSEPPATPRQAQTACRFDYSRKKVWDANGQEAIANGIMFLPPDASIGMKDRILFDTRLWNVVGISRLKYKTRMSHIEVFVV